MKIKSLMVIVLVMMAGLATAQSLSSKQVPAVVLNAFQQKFPKAKDVEWKKKATHFEVSFEMGWKFTDHEVWISPEGEILQHKEDLSSMDLPKAIKEAIKKNYHTFKIDEVVKIYRKTEVFYQVEMEKGREELKRIFQPNGKEIEKK
jgi:hypothetical protein